MRIQRGIYASIDLVFSPFLLDLLGKLAGNGQDPVRLAGQQQSRTLPSPFDLWITRNIAGCLRVARSFCILEAVPAQL